MTWQYIILPVFLGDHYCLHPAVICLARISFVKLKLYFLSLRGISELFSNAVTMSSHFSANQYEDAFKSVKLQNWQSAKTNRECPKTQEGFTEVIANDRGHLLPGVTRSKKSPWDTGYVNAWAMPHKIPGNCTSVKTGRSTYAQQKLQEDYKDGERLLSGRNRCHNKQSSQLDESDRVRMTTPPCGACRCEPKVFTPAPVSPPPQDRRYASPPMQSPPVPAYQQDPGCGNRSVIAV